MSKTIAQRLKQISMHVRRPMFFAVLLCATGADAAHTQTHPQLLLGEKNVLVLHADETSAPLFESTRRGISAALQSGGIGSINQFFEYLDLRRNPSPEHLQKTIELLRLRYSLRKVDLVITLYPEALELILEESLPFFSTAPIVALYLPLSIDLPKTDRLIIKHSVRLDMVGTLQGALKLVPEAKRVYVVSGAHEMDRKYKDQALRDCEQWNGRLEFCCLSGLPPEEILEEISKASSESIVFLLSYSMDISGKQYTARWFAERLSRVSKAPLFGLYDTLLGFGIVGGSLVSSERIGTRAGELALDILRGARGSEDTPTFLDVPYLPMFDWGQLRRWSLRESALPEGSIVINKEVTLWDFRYLIIGGLALILLQSFLVTCLAISSRRRRSAEGALRRKTEELSERLKFEKLLSEISSRFVNLRAGELASQVEYAQRQVCQCLDLDLSTFWEVSEANPRQVILSSFYKALGGPPVPQQMNALEHFPWTLLQLSAGNIVALSVKEAPAEASRDQEMWRHFGIKSVLAFPLSVGGGSLFGVLSFETMREERTWPETKVKQLQLLAQVFTNALARKWADLELREREACLSLATNATGAGLWVMPVDMSEVWVAARTRELFHFAPDEKLTYDSFIKVIHQDDREQVQRAVQQAIEFGRSLKIDFRIVLPDGRIRWIAASGQPYPGTKPVRLMGVSLDITERIQAGQAMEEHLRFERVYQMAELAASLAHELSQPLTSILSNASAALRFIESGNFDVLELKNILQDIAEDDKRAGRIIQTLRAMFRQDKGEREPVAINSLCREVIELFKGEAVARKIRVETELCDLLPPVMMNRTQIEQVLVNLLMNAGEWMDDGARERKITVRTSIQDMTHVRMEVCDTGSGIDEKDLVRIFEPFFTRKRAGIGMGLSLCRTIIEAHGGYIRARNNKDKGASFLIDLPVMENTP